jgi:hypothetical protein
MDHQPLVPTSKGLLSCMYHHAFDILPQGERHLPDYERVLLCLCKRLFLIEFGIHPDFHLLPIVEFRRE